VVKGFVIQSGHLPTRTAPLGETQQRYVRQMKAEFNDQLHVKGTLSMARLAENDSASTSFFIVTATADALDGKYSAFGQVESGTMARRERPDGRRPEYACGRPGTARAVPLDQSPFATGGGGCQSAVSPRRSSP
jgi:peptidylprolyl isomerase